MLQLFGQSDCLTDHCSEIMYMMCQAIIKSMERNLPSELTVASLVKKFPVFCGIRTMFTTFDITGSVHCDYNQPYT
jgi:hypothetical protein